MIYDDIPTECPGAFVDAQQYTGNEGWAYTWVGEAQLEILTGAGCRPHHHVLEIGCGSLSAGHLIIPYLEPGHYVGIDPNLWLVRAAVETIRGMRDVVAERRPRFLQRTDFDGSSEMPPGGYDFILSHSVLSHAAAWQLPQFMAAARKVISPTGKALVSWVWGNDTNAAEWRYPQHTCFSMQTIWVAAAAAGWKFRIRPDWRERMISAWKTNIHKWLELIPLIPEKQS